MSDKALVHVPQEPEKKPAKAEDPADRLARRYEKVQLRDLDIVDGMNRYADIPTPAEPEERQKVLELLNASDAEIKRAGWKNRKELRAAIYGTLPRSKWPAAMQAAHERVGMRLRKQDRKASQNKFNVNIINIPAAQPPTAEEKVVVVDVGEDRE